MTYNLESLTQSPVALEFPHSVCNLAWVGWVSSPGTQTRLQPKHLLELSALCSLSLSLSLGLMLSTGLFANIWATGLPCDPFMPAMGSIVLKWQLPVICVKGKPCQCVEVTDSGAVQFPVVQSARQAGGE